MISAPIYLDHAAATPVDEAAFVAMQPFLSDAFYNPSAVYQAAREVRKQVEAARGAVASVLGAKDQELIFTAGGTEANNLAIHGIMQQFPEGNIVVSSIEHESVLESAKQYDHRIAPVTEKGVIDLVKLESLIDERTVLVSIMYANNEVGTVQPLKEISALIQKKRATHAVHPLFLHTDACQAANYLDLQVARLGVDLMTVNGGKIYAPKQSGCLYIKTGTGISSLMQGGGQESGIRSGTENVPAIIAFATMLQKVQNERKAESLRIEAIKNKVFAILSQKIPTVILNGDTKRRLPNNLNITIPGVDGERLLMEFDEVGLQVATGSACTASNDEPSHVLLAMGLAPAAASASLRLTFGRMNKNEEVSLIIEKMVSVITAHQAQLL